MLCTDRCKKCTYSGLVLYTTICCDYMNRTGEPRGCPAGDNCDKFEECEEKFTDMGWAKKDFKIFI